MVKLEERLRSPLLDWAFLGARFTVDTHVFRELGELLVGRDSTALIELIKNSYDADATEVTIFADSLDDPGEGYILVTDDGTGMTPSQFEEGFLRIASRNKEEGERRSFKFKRRFTGAKGIGRLAAHKLAKLLTISSVPAKELGQTGVQATIDWEQVEKYETLDKLADSQTNAIIVEPKAVSGPQKPGTEIRLERLRKAWTPTEMSRFISEVQSFSPPTFLVSPEQTFIRPFRFLFETAKVADYKRTAPFVPKLQGEFTPGHDFWKQFTDTADWFIEIDCVTDPDVVRYRLTPTRHFREKYPQTKSQKIEVPHPGAEKAPHFQARIIVREGMQGKGPLKSWATSNYGIRVFMEGFRVLPYGERSNDWLQLDRHYVERMRTSIYLTAFGFDNEPGGDRNALLQHLGNRNYYGAVFLTQEGARGLKMLVNREGFVPDSMLDNLSDLVRLGIDLTTRARAAAKFHTREERRESRNPQEPQAGIRARVGLALNKIGDVRKAVAHGDLNAANEALVDAESTFRDFGERIADENAMLRILASVGSQMAAFVHEINATLGMAQASEQALAKIDTAPLSAAMRRELAKVQKGLGDLRRHLEREASYLVDVVTTDVRRRRTRNFLGERFDAAMRLVARSAEIRNITIENKIQMDLKSPPMFAAELTSAFGNLLTNAVKAAGQDGKIRASSRIKEGDHIAIRVENTGIEVDLSDAERWFQPFESTTAKVDTVLGQGMGLGLTITRNILEQYGASIAFVRPSAGYATALEVTFPIKA